MAATKQISATLPKETHELLRIQAGKLKRSISETVAITLDGALRKIAERDKWPQVTKPKISYIK